jgi:ribonuclease HI
LTLHLYVDGGSRGNPGPAGYGVLVASAEGETIERLRGALGVQTNNYAEYRGLIAGLEFARAHGAEAVRVFSDSLLMVRQMQGRYAVKSPNLAPLQRQAQALARAFSDFAIEHVRREYNREADALANQAMDAAQPPGRQP